MKKRFPALLLGIEEGGSIDVIFPDFPGCVSQGDDLEDALRMGAEALQGHIECMVDAGESVPAEGSKAQLAEGAKENPGSCVALVEVDVPEGKAQRINITIPEDVLAKIDGAVKSMKGETRSGLLVKGALDYIARRRPRQRSRAKARA